MYLKRSAAVVIGALRVYTLSYHSCKTSLGILIKIFKLGVQLQEKHARHPAALWQKISSGQICWQLLILPAVKHIADKTQCSVPQPTQISTCDFPLQVFEYYFYHQKLSGLGQYLDLRGHIVPSDFHEADSYQTQSQIVKVEIKWGRSQELLVKSNLFKESDHCYRSAVYPENYFSYFSMKT